MISNPQFRPTGIPEIVPRRRLCFISLQLSFVHNTSANGPYEYLNT